MRNDIYFVLTGVTTPTGGREQLESFLDTIRTEVVDEIARRIKDLNRRETKTLADYIESENRYNEIFYMEYNRAVDNMKGVTEKFTGINLDTIEAWKLDKRYFAQFNNFQQYTAVVNHNLYTLRTILLGIFEESR